MSVFGVGLRAVKIGIISLGLLLSSGHINIMSSFIKNLDGRGRLEVDSTHTCVQRHTHTHICMHGRMHTNTHALSLSHTQTDRQTDTDRDRQTDRQTQLLTHTFPYAHTQLITQFPNS